jgi:hypothetical protein
VSANAELDIFQRFELEVRTPKRRLLIDALLPSPESIASAVTPPPPPPPLPGESVDEMRAFARLEEQAPEPEEKPKPRRKVAAAPKKKKAAERPMSLQEEIDEFMNRGGSALAPDEDVGPFKPPPLDPKPDPDSEPKK